MNEYCFEIILLLAAHEGDGADQHRDVEQDLLLFAGDGPLEDDVKQNLPASFFFFFLNLYPN